MRILVDGRGLLESPRWHGGRLYFADWSAGEVLAVAPDGGGTEVVARVDSLPLCIAWLPGDRLIIVDSRRGRLLRREPGGALVPHAELGRPGWNDIAADGRGNIYVNGAGFDPMAGQEFAPGAVFRAADVVLPAADDIAFPNGMAVTPDDRTLIVADSYRHHLLAFDIGPDGALANRRVWAELGTGVPDGICIDAEGAVWYADVPNRCCVRVAAGGAELQRVTVDRGAFACALGGSTLFVTAARWQGMTAAQMVEPGSGQVLAIEVAVPNA
ncbi:SMP-30/gluconolactonase/LRE family protein [Dactylosporangium vinaceum]|uniref:SMP-30/gluconolactonase/LRE family protein n=1 Tax=Dactylosporangium vinaceum TaxID=53362 RepID=A0ABV5MKD6_9ACTN|nr:SMP-30/gluconolactonase/LRE family protein [Dactylosporangium vinaceum]UAB92635.1 SMP-30/gluconolactonase/LRE family protein [Dactylosporangium vinaceum]